MGRYYNSYAEKSRDINEEDVNYEHDELIELYDVEKKMDENIKELWDNVVVKYIEFCDDSQIIEWLSSEHDYYKFRVYMIKNNIMYGRVLDRIYELENAKAN